MDYLWDPAKALANERKHGVSFEQARTLFESGAERLEVFDAAHSELEDRFIAIGPVQDRLKNGTTTRSWVVEDD